MKRLVAMMFMTVTAFSTPLSAWECASIPLKTSFDLSEIVLSGRVDAVRYSGYVEGVRGGVASEPPNGLTHLVAIVRVLELWKGSTPATIELHQPLGEGGMGLDQKVGTTYLFFLRQLSASRPLFHPFTHVTWGYTADPCASKQREPASDPSELGKSYSPKP